MEHWSTAHLAALAVTGLAAVGLTAAARRRGAAAPAWLRRGLALLLLAAFAGEQLAYALRGDWSLRVNLPFQLTDAVTLVSAAALWRPAPRLVELTYLWALSATLQALLTPALDSDPPDVLYFTYFTTHGGAVAAACLLVIGERRPPGPGAVRRAFATTAAFAACAAAATLATGGNYMFLRRKPADGSLLDVMGPWPVYIVTAAALGLALFAGLAWLARATLGATGPRRPARP